VQHITTYTGEDFDPFSPDIDRIKIEDIAHALSLTCRANGHVKHFYSVAQHCINCVNEAKARKLPARVQLACLLHDASEAYISDITRPVKSHLSQYLEIEKTLQDKIYKKFVGTQLSDEEQALVAQVDDDILVWEFDALMEKKVFDKLPKISSRPFFGFVDFTIIEKMFISEMDINRC
jgi:Predicted hydrolases of HD superfamily